MVIKNACKENKRKKDIYKSIEGRKERRYETKKGYKTKIPQDDEEKFDFHISSIEFIFQPSSIHTYLQFTYKQNFTTIFRIQFSLRKYSERVRPLGMKKGESLDTNKFRRGCNFVLAMNASTFLLPSLFISRGMNVYVNVYTNTYAHTHIYIYIYIYITYIYIYT